MPNTSQTCTLCGLPLRYGNHNAAFNGQTLNFCCGGCVMVYTMLMEASHSPDPEKFKQSELYRRCVRAGVIPATEDDLADTAVNKENAAPSAMSQDPPVDSLVLQLKVEGMWCPACAWVVQSALEKLAGVQEAICDFATDRLRCSYNPVQADPDTIAATIRSLGYSPLSTENISKLSIRRAEFIRLIICAFLSANVMMLSWSLYSGSFTSLSHQEIRFISWPIWIMTTVVMLYGGAHLFRKALWGLRALAPGMETLVCLGAGSAYVYSLYNFFSGSWHLYFDTASMLITLVLLGKMLEAKSKAKVRHDLEGFLSLQPNKVRLCTPSFPQGRFVALKQMKRGDHYRVQTDEMVPADGRIISGQGLVDESSVTGESRPKTVGKGHRLTSGTLLIKGDVTAAASRIGEDALIGQMITVIESSLARRTPLESRTDRWLALFVPLMVVLATGTAIVGYSLGMPLEAAFKRGLTVLVIACPCALGIAIPLARIGGISEAGKLGILVRDFEAFERACRVQSVVMDKTGTLTRGNWTLSQLAPVGKIDGDEALALAAGLEHGVDHAVAQAVLVQARKQGIHPAPLTQVKKHENGMEGICKDRTVKIGTWSFVTTDAPPPKEMLLSKGPLSLVYLSIDQKVSAVLGFGDEKRAGVDEFIQQLKSDGYQLHLISGDTRTVTQAIAETLTISVAFGDLRPNDKAAYVARLQKNGHIVAMMGDGINDAAALSVADLSVALHRDAALVQQAAAVTLMRSDPSQLIDFFNLAKQVNAKIGQNLGCAWIYNLISIPVAMSGLLNPLVAVTAMLLSSLTVIGNTLLMMKKNRRKTHGFHLAKTDT